MGKGNFMNLWETQEYVSSMRHEWQVSTDMKDRVDKMVQKYNMRAEKKGYGDSVFEFNDSALILSGIFVAKKGSNSFIGQLKEGATNGDLCEDLQNILRLCFKVCPDCDSQIPALAKTCEICGAEFLKNKAVEIESENVAVEKTDDNTNAEIETKEGVKYELFVISEPIDVPKGIAYYDDILSNLEKFIAIQEAKPKNETRFFMALDLDKLGLNEDEALDDDDLRLGINSFDISNVVFSKYNKWMPLFEDKVNSGLPQIFITVLDWQADIKKIAEFAVKYNISYAWEKGTDKYNRKYARIILAFDDDVVEATDFLCYVATNILSVPKEGVPISIGINSLHTKIKAQKEYKKAHAFNVRDYAKGIHSYLTNKTDANK